MYNKVIHILFIFLWIIYVYIYILFQIFSTIGYYKILNIAPAPYRDLPGNLEDHSWGGHGLYVAEVWLKRIIPVHRATNPGKQTLPHHTVSQAPHPWPSPPQISFQLDNLLPVPQISPFPSSLALASFLSGFFRNSTFFFPLVMQRFSSLPFSVWTLPGGGVDLTSRFKEALPSLISLLLSLLPHILCVAGVGVMVMLPNKGAAQHRWQKQMLIRSKMCCTRKSPVTDNNKHLLLTHLGYSAQHLCWCWLNPLTHLGFYDGLC